MTNYAKYQISFKLLLRKEDKFLMLRDNDEIWDLPGGRIDNSEIHGSTAEIISREIEEELGEDVKYRLKSPIVQFTRNILGQKELVMIMVFDADYISGNIKLSKEHKSYKWIDPLKEKLTKKDFFSNDEYLIFSKYFKNSLKEKKDSPSSE